MKRLYDAAAAVRSALLCQSSNQRTARAARNLDPIVRDALATTLQENDCLRELEELDAELDQVKDSLQQAVKREQFLGLRSRHYRQVLDTTARTLHQERAELKAKAPSSSGQDEEADAVYKQSLAEWEARMEKWEKDQDALKAIQATHTQILATIEDMRRTIRKLEQKKSTVYKLNDQCQEFVSAAAVATAGSSAGAGVEDHDTADVVDVESTPENKTEPPIMDGAASDDNEAEGEVNETLSSSLAEDASSEILIEPDGSKDSSGRDR